MATINDRFNDLVEAKDRVRELHTSIIEAVADEADLSTLNSTSKTAIWRLWAFVTACCMWLLEQLWLLFRKDVDTLVATAIPATDRWLANDVKRWQYGHSLLVDPTTLRLVYAEDDAEARLIVASAVQSRGGVSLLKVAKSDGGDGLEPLTEVEFTSFSQGFLDDVQPVGANIRAESRPADLLQLPYDIYYDANYTEADMRGRVEEAMMTLLRNLPFNGAFYIQRLTDAIQNVAGVMDVVPGVLVAQIQVTGGGTPPPATTLGRVYFPLAGYLQIDPSTPLSTSLTFTPEQG